jgi:tetratricopeptide (TPR) repeat protein
MPPEALRALVDEGRIADVERALREQNVRVPAVLGELDRILEAGLGNLAVALVTMLISSFHVARASQLAERALAQADRAGVEELTDLAAALMLAERLNAAEKAIAAALAQDPSAGRAIYLKARLHARRGQLGAAFDVIAKVSPKLLEGAGLATQARYAALAGRDKAKDAALKLARKAADEASAPHVTYAESVIARLDALGQRPADPWSLRTAIAIEYGAILVELASDAKDGGRFGMDPPTAFDLGRLLDRMAKVLGDLGARPTLLLYATEDGEIVAAALSEKLGVPYREVRHDRPILEGEWLCMGSAGTHPHVGKQVVAMIQEALDSGTLRTLALVLAAGWRAPIVPDLIGRITGDDELPWRIDDEVEDVLSRMKDEDEGHTRDYRSDEQALAAHLERHAGIFRALLPAPRPGHVPFLDETPVPRG